MKNWKSQFKEWLKEICPWEKMEDYVLIVADSEPPTEMRVRIYTKDYCYGIKANERYLGCIMTCRKPRAGETWNRGNDLPDGKFNRKTWDAIKNAIIANELVKIIKPKKATADKNEWKKLNSHYSRKSEGKKLTLTEFYYAEWEQKGDEIRNQHIYKRVK